MNKCKYLAAFLLVLSGCSGGGNEAKVIIEGTLIQGGTTAHANGSSANITLKFQPKHGAGEPIGNVEICALGECATTNELGQWGFGVDPTALGQDVLFTFVGHHIDASLVVNVPSDIASALITLHNKSGQPEVQEMTVITNEGEEIETHEHSD